MDKVYNELIEATGTFTLPWGNWALVLLDSSQLRNSLTSRGICLLPCPASYILPVSDFHMKADCPVLYI